MEVCGVQTSKAFRLGLIVTPIVFIIFAFWCGEFTNSFTLAKMKILTKGKHLWSRTIGSTIVGEAVDSIVFYPLAFAGLAT